LPTLSEFHAIADREVKACLAAASIGLVAKKSPLHTVSTDNLGGFTIVDPKRQCTVAGERFDMSPEEVIAYCENVSLSA
jgi:hypothetical protein